MKRKRVVYICLLCFLVGAGGWLAVSRILSVQSAASVTPLTSDQPDPYVGIARDDLTPETVVRRQVEAIRASVASPERIRECFAFASPGNRAMTGPVERFAEMVMSEPYTSLAKDPEFQVGTAIVEGDFSAVLVTVVSESGTPSAYRFMLERQSVPPYENCWMTVAVDSVDVEAGTGSSSLPR